MHPYTKLLFSAVPSIDPDQKLSFNLLEAQSQESVPVLFNEGCSFHPRCNQRIGTCGTETSPLRTMPDGRRIACHLYEEDNL